MAPRQEIPADGEVRFFQGEGGPWSVDAVVGREWIHVQSLERDGRHGRVLACHRETGALRSRRLDLLGVTTWRLGAEVPPLRNAAPPPASVPGEAEALRLRLLAGIAPQALAHPLEVLEGVLTRVEGTQATIGREDPARPVSSGGFRYDARGGLRFQLRSPRAGAGLEHVTDSICIALGLWIGSEGKGRSCRFSYPEMEVELRRTPRRRALAAVLAAMALPAARIHQGLAEEELRDLYEGAYQTWGVPSLLLWRRITQLMEARGQVNLWPNPMDPSDRIPF